MLKLKKFAKTLLNKIMLRPLPGPYTRVSGHCWSADLPLTVDRAARGDTNRNSSLLLYEDAVPLTYPYSSHDDIGNHGRSRFSHIKGKVLFSTSNNSDPNTNGRLYQYSVSPWIFRRRMGLLNGRGIVPCNHISRDADPEQIEQDVAYALKVGKNYLEQIRSLLPSVEGRSVLEVGPGINYGAVLVMACHGMRPMVADRFLAPWEAKYHNRFYSALADAVAANDATADVSPLRTLIRKGAYDPEVITCLSSPLEELPLPDNRVDVVFSNAVVEHLFDLKRSFARLYRITRPGGYGLHQVDFRDHRSFDRPLEYLLLEEGDFQSLASACHLECGNRYRPDETTAIIQAEGFEVKSFHGNCFSSEDYLADFVPRLRAANDSRYHSYPIEKLRIVSGHYRLRKPAN